MLIETWNENETVDFFHLSFGFISMLIDGAASLNSINSADGTARPCSIRFCYTTLSP